MPMSRSVYDRTGPIPRWDEGLPLGNGLLGCLVWGTAQALNFSLDLSGLWDETPAPGVQAAGFSFDGLRTMVEERQWDRIRQVFDLPYDDPAPTKLPAGRLVLRGLGEPSHSRYSLRAACGSLTFKKGQLTAWVHATAPVGIVRLEDVHDGWTMDLLPPAFAGGGAEAESCVGEKALSVLGYPAAERFASRNTVGFAQRFPGGAFAAAAVRREQQGGTVLYFSVARAASVRDAWGKAKETVENAAVEALPALLREHWRWWSAFWRKSSLRLPSGKLEKAWNFANYALACCSRPGGAPCSLQGVGTADNGLLPPWKGDYHHDLNTELSYWPAYTGNHLTEGLGYLNTLWAQRDTYKRYTRQYFGTDGMNVPGVCTLTGEPMGGWIQYAMSPTVGAWLAHHFYLHWKYSADPEFLRDRAYPFLKDVAVYLEQISYVSDGVRRLPLSSSPEMFDNSRKAWFDDLTNFDLAQMRFAFSAAAEMASALGRSDEASHWRTVGAQLPDLDTDADGALTIAPGFPYAASHRHFSHAVAIHPLGLLDWSQGEAAQRTIRATVKKLKDNGPAWWCGYSYSWFACLAARAFDGEATAQALRTFAECFCLPNTFHANGDQTASGKSNFTYRPFTLEGNFAFAAGVQEMLLQSHTGVVHVFPAIPAGWTDVAFRNLRAQGAFLVSATKSGGRLTQVQVRPEQGGTLRLALPAGSKVKELRGATATDTADADILTLQTEKGKTVTLTFE